MDLSILYDAINNYMSKAEALILAHEVREPFNVDDLRDAFEKAQEHLDAVLLVDFADEQQAWAIAHPEPRLSVVPPQG